MFKRTTRSIDGVAITYSVSGTADTAIVPIHGGLSDRSFWDGQHGALSDRFRVIAPDLAGHGESGRNRAKWGLVEFAHDVLAAIDGEGVRQAILVGNSLGGPVAIETALLAGTRAVGVIGADTFQDLGRRIDPRHWTEQADAWRPDFDGSLDRMLGALFHPDAPQCLVVDVRRWMSRTPVETACAIFFLVCGLRYRRTGASVARAGEVHQWRPISDGRPRHSRIHCGFRCCRAGAYRSFPDAGAPR